MSYLLKSNKQNKGFAKPILYSLAVLLLLCTLYSLTPRFINENLFSIARPIWAVRDYVTNIFSKIYTAIESKEELATRNVFLESELADAQVSFQLLDTVKRENSQLKEMLGRTKSESRLLATVIETPNHSIYDTLILDVGEKNGVTIGDKIVHGDYIIGNIREVFTNHSKAVLFSSPGEIVDIVIGDRGIKAEATGKGGGNFVVKLPKDIAVNNGDLVSAPLINSKFFGSVGSTEQTESGTFQSILFSLPINFYELKWVEVIK